MKKNNRKMTIQRDFYTSALIPLIIISLVVVSSLTFSILYASTKNFVFIILLASMVSTLIIGFVVYTYFFIRRLKKTYVDGLYGVTSSLLKNLADNIVIPEGYPNNNIEEFKQLNNYLERVQVHFNNATLVSYNLDIASIPLKFLDEEKMFVTFESFKNNLHALIYNAQNYRNVLMEVKYDLDNDYLENDEIERIVAEIKRNFRDFSNLLIMVNEDKTGFYIYLPHINSFSRIKEISEYLVKYLSVAKKTFDGLKTISARFALVCYPYSNIGELFSDLSYATRQSAPFFMYLPNRIEDLSDNSILQNSLNLNNMSRILASVTSLKISERDQEGSVKTIVDAFEMINAYLHIDESGIINISYNASNPVVKFDTSTSENPIFKTGQVVEMDFLENLNNSKDDDDSFYFSTRSHATYAIGRKLDIYGISSGFYFVIIDSNKIRGLIYFFNKDKPFIIDSYLREALFSICSRVANFVIMSDREESFLDTYGEINAILTSSDYSLYRIDIETFNLVSFSNHFTTIFRNAKVGEKCYKALYGLDSQCPKCPLLTQKKMVSEIEGDNYEISLSLNRRESKLKRMLVHNRGNEGSSTDRFDKDLFIASYPSLYIEMKNLYSVSARGYLLILRIDNQENLIKQLGSEGYLYVLRQFIARIKIRNKFASNIYLHDNSSIAILMAETGQVDAVNLCETIYEASKVEYISNEVPVTFNITYLPYSFPSGYSEADSYLKFIYRDFISSSYTPNKDFIYFPDGDYSRSASKNEFMLSVIDSQFGNKTYQVVLQPIVKSIDKTINGAELFIRVSDDYRNIVFNTEQLVKVAAQNGKIGLISKELVNFIGEFYQQFGLTIFKVYGFNRLTINTDFSYFSDPKFFDDIYELMVSYGLPRDFLGFEINESEVAEHIDEFVGISKRLLNQHIALICDQYSGAHMSIDALKQLGFSEIKIGRSYVSDIETNVKHFNEIKTIAEIAEKNNIRVCFVGVENSTQYLMLKDLGKRNYLQGYHFYRPLEKMKLIEELRNNG